MSGMGDLFAYFCDFNGFTHICGGYRYMWCNIRRKIPFIIAAEYYRKNEKKQCQKIFHVQSPGW